MIPSEHCNRYFYHFTHVDNIESIIANGLISTNEKNKNKIAHTNIANEKIQGRRQCMDVSCPPYGKVHDYVPFYFTSRNQMLLSVINQKNIDQELIVYIAVSIDKINEDNVIFTNAAANGNIAPKFYNDPQYLTELNWKSIDKKSWPNKNDIDAQIRMAEALIYEKVPLDWISYFIVYGKMCKDIIEDLLKKQGLKKPIVIKEPINNTYFYFKKFLLKNRENESLITGPIKLKFIYDSIIEKVIKDRENRNSSNSTFENIADALNKINTNFCIVKELEGIYKLETDNKVHNKTVSEHTLEVVNNLDSINFYQELSEEDKNIVKLSAYFHDIGKGPKSNWTNGIQRAYADHPTDSLRYVCRILMEEFGIISNREIKIICLLVAYHDLIGDIINLGRSMQEIQNLDLSKNKLNMLIAISLADIKSINSIWYHKTENEISDFIDKLL